MPQSAQPPKAAGRSPSGGPPEAAEGPLPLDQQLCFSLYGASLAVTRTYKPLLDALGITYPQYLVLNVLWEQDGASVGTIADRLALEPSTVTPLVKRLEGAGLVGRARNPNDERQVLIRLTGEGWALRERCTCLGERLIEASGMSLDRLRSLAEEIRALRDRLAAIDPLPAG